MKRPAVVLLLFAWLALSLGLKAARFGGDGPTLNMRSEAAVTALMSRYGWHETGAAGLTTDNLVRSYSFGRPGCATEISVAVLDGGTTFAPLAKQAFGSDIAFVYRGVLAPVPVPSTWRNWFQSGLPLIAISPAPKGANGTCAAPDAAAWRALSES